MNILCLNIKKSESLYKYFIKLIQYATYKLFELVISVGWYYTIVILFTTKNYIRFARKNMNEIFARFLQI